ncbi:MAG: ribosome maturation factor RimP [Bacilli bacterium]|nr:ribosome maturation factor RimP [Bacilli bacterium]
MNDLNKISELLSPILTEIGYELIEVNFQNGKDGGTLSVVVDRPSPISLDDIVSVSEKISLALDESDPIAGAYTLDVSSLGAEKPIKIERLSEYADCYVNLHLSHPYKGENILEGTLVSVEGETVTLSIRDKSRTKKIEFPLKDVDKARLAIKF